MKEVVGSIRERETDVEVLRALPQALEENAGQKFKYVIGQLVRPNHYILTIKPLLIISFHATNQVCKSSLMSIKKEPVYL
jgi:hypothetical protein